MAGTVTTSEITHTTVKKITFTWTSSAGGAADATTTGYYNGRVIYVAQMPDGGGTQPTNAYDVVVTDSTSVDVLNGTGANLSNAANTYASDLSNGTGAAVETQLTLAVTNAGAAKGGKTILFIR